MNKCSYKGIIISTRKRPGYPWFYGLLQNRNSAILGRIERDDEGGIPTREKVIELAKYEINQGYFKTPEN